MSICFTLSQTKQLNIFTDNAMPSIIFYWRYTMDNNDLATIEEQLDYKFKNSDLLQQAFVRRSYSQEHGGENNEILEFIGDKILDVLVVKFLDSHFGFLLSDCDDFDSSEEFNEYACDLNEGELTKLKAKMIQRKTLAHRIDLFNFADYLIMGKGELKNNAQNQDSVKENLFEAILGAVAIDSDWNFKQLESVFEILLDPESFLEEDSEEDYISYIQEWFYKKYHYYPMFLTSNCSYNDMCSWYITNYEIRPKVKKRVSLPPRGTWGIGNQFYDTPFKCTLELLDKKFFGFGDSKHLAKLDVCELIYHYLCEENLIMTIKDEISNPNKKEAISQLETLARRGYFSLPTYDFKQSFANNGNPVWHCTCFIPEKNKRFSATSSSKKEAKKTVAFLMLKFILNE